MSDGPAEKRHGFERWVASLKLGTPIRPPSSPPPSAEGADGSPLTLDEQATLINRLPKEVIYKLRERDSQRAGMPKSDDSTAVFTPPPELLARAKRFEAPPKPERSSPTASTVPPSPRPTPPQPSSAKSRDLAAAEAAAFATLESDEEATTYFRPDIKDVAPPSSIPPALHGDLSRPGDIQWIDGLASSPPEAGAFEPPTPGAFTSTEPPPYQPVPMRGPLESAGASGSIAPSERTLRWVAIVVAVVLLAAIFALSRMQ